MQYLQGHTARNDAHITVETLSKNPGWLLFAWSTAPLLVTATTRASGPLTQASTCANTRSQRCVSLALRASAAAPAPGALPAHVRRATTPHSLEAAAPSCTQANRLDIQRAAQTERQSGEHKRGQAEQRARLCEVTEVLLRRAKHLVAPELPLLVRNAEHVPLERGTALRVGQLVAVELADRADDGLRERVLVERYILQEGACVVVRGDGVEQVRVPAQARPCAVCREAANALLLLSSSSTHTILTFAA
jgi:hypothetical protein